MAKDLLGQTFGRLTVIQLVRSEPGKGRIWLCRCECGNTKEIPTARLTSGHTQSCGCMLRDHAASIHTADIANQRFGRLIALAPTAQRDASGSILWQCRCDCGSETTAPVNALRSGRVQSCGCLFKESRTQIATRRRDKVNGVLVGSLIRGKTLRSTNKSGVTGVCRNQKTGKWLAYINIQKKRIFLGVYNEREDAVKARKNAEQQLHDPLIASSLSLLSEASRKKFKEYLNSAQESL